MRAAGGGGGDGGHDAAPRLPAQRPDDVQPRVRAEEARSGGWFLGGRSSARGSAAPGGGGAGELYGATSACREGSRRRERVRWPSPVAAVVQPAGRRYRRAHQTREREDARGAGGTAAKIHPCAAGRRLGPPARGGGRAGARAPPQRGAGGQGAAGGRGVRGVGGPRQGPRGRRRRPPRHPRPAPPAVAMRRHRPRRRGRRRGRAVVLLRAAVRQRRRRVPVHQGRGVVVQGVPRRGGVRAAAPVPAPVPVPSVRRHRRRLPRLRRRQERLAPRPAIMKPTAPVRITCSLLHRSEAIHASGVESCVSSVYRTCANRLHAKATMLLAT